MSMIKSTNEIVRGRAEQLSIPTEFNGVKSIGSIEEQLSPLETSVKVDRALQDTTDLISEKFKPWYAKQAYRLGVDRYLGIASDARRGRSPQKLFSYMLRRA